MCIALPAHVVSIDPGTQRAEALFGEVLRMVDLTMTPGVQVGDWVIAHSGFAVRSITADDAAAVMQILEQPADS
jgi:hydrogenase expression/formation protein HypC